MCPHLRSFSSAMGGQLQIKAIFPEGDVEIEQFKDAAAAPADSNEDAAA